VKFGLHRGDASDSDSDSCQVAQDHSPSSQDVSSQIASVFCCSGVVSPLSPPPDVQALAARLASRAQVSSAGDWAVRLCRLVLD
jgi:hypothetical protein